MTKDMSLRAVGWAQSFPVSHGVRAGRRWTRDHLASLEWTEVAPETVDAILLTVSELITNAHVHAHSDAQLVLTWDSRCLHVSVHDSDPVPPPSSPKTSRRPVGADWPSSTRSPTDGRRTPGVGQDNHRLLRSSRGTEAPARRDHRLIPCTCCASGKSA